MNSFLPILRYPVIRELSKICNIYSKSVRNQPLLLLKFNDLFTTKCINARGMAGHSKWQNIKQIKTLKDGEKSKVNSKFAILLKKAAKDGGINPKLNSKLATVIAQAKEANVPSATIENVLKRVENKKLTTGTGEIMGPGGSFFVLDLEVEQMSLTVHHMKVACRKVGGCRLADSGRSKLLFQQKGILRVKEKNDGSQINAEKILDDAIEAGAEEVNEDKDEDGTLIFEFVTSVEDMHKVKKQLETMRYSILEFGLEYIPRQRVTLSEEDLDSVAKLHNLLEEMEDVQKIYDNVEYKT